MISQSHFASATRACRRDAQPIASNIIEQLDFIRMTKDEVEAQRVKPFLAKSAKRLSQIVRDGGVYVPPYHGVHYDPTWPK